MLGCRAPAEAGSNCYFYGLRTMAKTQSLEFPVSSSAIDAVLAALSFDENGLVSAVAHDSETSDVLMLAWMNEQALRETLETGQVCYFSRSRNALWRKGETSKQTQRLKGLRIDCDGDALLLSIVQTGVACHTGRKSCFYKALDGDALADILPVEKDPKELYGS